MCTPSLKTESGRRQPWWWGEDQPERVMVFRISAESSIDDGERQCEPVPGGNNQALPKPGGESSVSER